MIRIDPIVDAALLGTSARRVDSASFPEQMRPYLADLAGSGQCYEDSLMRAVSMLFAYRNCGAMPGRVAEDDFFPECISESLPYMRDSDASLMLYLRSNGLSHLLLYALRHFAAKRQILPPHFVPEFAELITSKSSKYMYQYRLQAWPLLGNRGKWLLRCLNIGVDKFSESPHRDRLKMLVAMRKAGVPDSSRLLASIWPSIGSRERKDFLSVMLRVMDSDLDFLWDAFRQGGPDGAMALRLMCAHPGSRPVEAFMDLLGQSLQIDGDGCCNFQEIASNSHIEGYGILPGENPLCQWPAFVGKLPDGEAIICKLILSVPLKFWMRKLGCGPGKAAQFLDENPAFRPALDFAGVISRLRDKEWAAQYCIVRGIILAQFIEFMDAGSLETAAPHCDIDPGLTASERMLGMADDFEAWGPEFSRAVLSHIVHARNFENTSIFAQYLAVRLSRRADAEIEMYLRENNGNDIVSSFLARVASLRRIIGGII